MVEEKPGRANWLAAVLVGVVILGIVLLLTVR